MLQRMLALWIVLGVCGALGESAHAQLPADAVLLDKVKIAEKQKSVDLCPVYLTKSDPELPTWQYKGVTYRGAKADAKEKFLKDADTYAEKAKYQRWENNFIASMSIIWCPVTDEVNPGGGKQWEKIGITWESCCKFCDEDATEEDFPEALKRLKERAKESYKLTKGKYVENAKSPVEGAIKNPDDEEQSAS
jgi:hypothetical protein